MAFSVREATVKDFDVVYQFVCELQHKVFDRDLMKQLYQKNISNPDNVYLVAYDQQKAIGYLSCHLQTLLHHAGTVAEIQEMFVAAEYRSKGVGTILMNTIKQLAKAKGALQLEVTTRMIREKAIQFYVREAFENSHRKLVYYFK
ncbi:MAG TPA: GNAT family N-acetyltransferase [Cytophagales bacterium]|nr:GNAT family N-acetyltransferase [Cytophagales bacterium]HCR53285.1 GNAT family N-acetyltransferase [Cytophagales bacterium]